MARIKIDLPDNFIFSTIIPVRITDINYSGHTGNDTILSLIHEARAQFFANIGYTELEFDGVGTIMADVGIEFKKELFYGEMVFAAVAVDGFSKVSFDLYYKLEKELNGKKVVVAKAKTAMVCFDYKNKKITLVPDAAKQKLIAGS